MSASPTVRDLSWAVFFFVGCLWAGPLFLCPSDAAAREEGAVVAASETGSLRGSILVSAASSLTEVFSLLAMEFEALHPEVDVRLNFGGSALLAAQIDQGAPVSVIAAAGMTPLEALIVSGKVERDFVRSFAIGELVLVARGRFDDIASLAELANTNGRVAMANPKLAPAGKYAQAALQNLELQQSFAGRVVLAENVRQVLRYVETGVVVAGLVYRTDLRASHQLRIVEPIPRSATGEIAYPIAPILGREYDSVARSFVEFVITETGMDILSGFGFRPPSSAGAKRLRQKP